MLKLKKYINYLSKFMKSKNKRKLLKEYIIEIVDKGFKSGTQSILHAKIIQSKTLVESTVSIGQNYDTSIIRVLPLNSAPLVSIIIPTYNQVTFTFDCICAILENAGTDDYEIIIANDNPNDINTINLSRSFINLKIVTNSQNLGFLRNCNNAVKSALGKYVVLLNNDTLVQKNWLIELLNIFNNHSNVGLVGSKLIYADGRLQEAGGIVWQDGSAWNYGNGDNPNKPEYNYVKEVDYISGASIMISKALWDELGGFDELYLPAYYEDTDLCFKVRQSGYKVYYQPFSEVIHFEGITHGTDINSGIKKYQQDNAVKFYMKWKSILDNKSPNGVNVFFERDRSIEKKHILIFDHNIPTVDQDAGSRCISNFIDCFIALDFMVTFIASNPHHDIVYRKMFQEKGVNVLYGDEYEFWNERYLWFLREHLDHFDMVLCSRSSVCINPLIFLRNNQFEGKILYFGHDLGYLRLEQEFKLKNDLSISLAAMRSKADEDFMYKNVDVPLVCSNNEVEYLLSHKINATYIPPYFFEVDRDIPDFGNRVGLMFVGGFQHTPNQDAIRWFVEEVYPELVELNIPLTIAGSKMPEFILNYQKEFPLITVRPDISTNDLSKLYNESKIVIAPLRVGAGVKGKVIEAMSKGVPVVGTERAFEGIPKGIDFIYIDSNSKLEFIEQVKKLNSNKEYWALLSKFGQSYVEKYFHKDVMLSVLRDSCK